MNGGGNGDLPASVTPLPQLDSDRHAALPRAGLVVEATPLERWPQLSRELGTEVWAKRDDLLPLALGGNKVRKLDLILGQARADGVDTVITHGGVQSNHCRLSAAAAARLGMRCVLVLHGAPVEPGAATGNLLLDHLFGATVDFVSDADAAPERMRQHAARSRSAGGNPLIIPLGASTALGAAAYVLAAAEFSQQCAAAQLTPAAVYVTLGSAGTAAGLVAGLGRYVPQCRTVAVNIAALAAPSETETVSMLAAAAFAELELQATQLRYEVRNDFSGAGYGRATPECLAALRLAARSEGVLLDPSYTAKTMAALISDARSGATGPLVFWHTGGAAALFARDPRELLQR